MKQMFQAIKKIVDEYSDVKVIYPVHMNPQVRKIAENIFAGNDKFHLIEPLDVYDFHNFIANSYLILTDSGGIQEEAPALGKPVLVMRETTERPEGIAAGTLRLVGVEEGSIYSNFKELLDNTNTYKNMSNAENPYGDGKASVRITDKLFEYSV